MEEPIEIIEDLKPSILKKIFLIILALFLLFLIITFFVTNPQTRHILAGLIESSTLKDYEININNTNKLIFNKQTYNQLMELYNINLGKEFKVCLNGYMEEGNYYINKIFIPKTYLQTHNQVIAQPCPSTSLVSMHSHPLKHCLPSQQDLKNFEIFKMDNPNALMAIMCEKNRFNFYLLTEKLIN